jgi:hypothetical protein
MLNTHAIHGMVSNTDEAEVVDSDGGTLEEILTQIGGAEVLVTVTVLSEPCVKCLHRERK